MTLLTLIAVLLLLAAVVCAFRGQWVAAVVLVVLVLVVWPGGLALGR